MTPAEIRALVRYEVRQALAQSARAVKYTKTTASGQGDETEGEQTLPDEPTIQVPVRRYQHFGMRSRPPAGVDVIRVRTSAGTAGNSAVIAEESSRFGPSDLNDGEVALYNKVIGLRVLLDQNGTIHIQVPPGQKVAIDDGSGAAALATKADIDALKSWASSHAHSGVSTGAGTSGPPAVTPPSASGTTILQGK